MQTNPLVAAIDSVDIGPAVVVANLTMIPLLARQPGAASLDYVVLDQALTSGVVEITEVSEQGSVPELRLINRGTKPVLVVDGEELIGAKQNRIVNLTILVAAGSAVTITVSCVESGRWRARSRSFASAPRTQYASGRAKRMAHVSSSMVWHGNRVSDQADVWNDIAEKSTRLNAPSPTGAMAALYSVHSQALDEFVEGLQPVDGQVGAMFAVGDKVIGFDLFDRASALRDLLPKLVRSAAIDAIDSQEAEKASRSSGDATRLSVSAQAAQFLKVTAASPQHVARALALGEDVRLTASHVAGAALTFDGGVVHLGAFAL